MNNGQFAHLPYRPCVGLMVLNRAGHIFAGQRHDNSAEAWQMPQGGIDPGETPATAALRELGEETGLSPNNVEIIRESAGWVPYDLPDTIVPKLWSGKYRGQEQKWFALRFLGDDQLININTAHPEFKTWCWMQADELIGKIVPFKRGVYDAVFTEFADLLAPKGASK